MMDKPKILFLCTGNSCRSQMAEAWTRTIWGNQLEAYSAGVAPHGVDPRAVRVMSEAGIDISRQQSKHVDTLPASIFQYVVTVCDHAREACPFFPAAVKTVHLGFPDPPTLAEEARNEEEALEHYRRVRDEIKSVVERLPELLEL